MHYVHVDTGRACAFVRRCAIHPNCRGALCVCVLQVLDIAAQHGMLVLIEVKELHKRGELIRQLVQLFADRDLYVPHTSSKRSWRAMLRFGLCKPPCCPVCKPPCCPVCKPPCCLASLSATFSCCFAPPVRFVSFP